MAKTRSQHTRKIDAALGEVQRNEIRDAVLTARSTQGIEGREWLRLLYGPDHFESAQVTKGSLDSISRQDLIDFHQRLWHPGNLIIAVSGDVEASRILPALERRMAAASPHQLIEYGGPSRQSESGGRRRARPHRAGSHPGAGAWR